MKIKLITGLIICTVLSTKLVVASELFLMGGAIDDNNSNIYNALAKATGKIAEPNQCSDDWTKTTCPKIAIVTSAAADKATGDDIFNNDEPDSLSYKSLYSKYGFSVKHISAHIDNYQQTTNPNTLEGKLNKTILEQADVIFFNGGDQARHARTWLNDDGSYNQLMQIIATRFIHNQVIIAGSSAGTAIQSSPTYGEGASFGHLYFANSQGLANKSVRDGGVNGSGLQDMRAPIDSLQNSDNGGKMSGFAFAPDSVLVDTHFDARGRLARLIPALRDTHKQIGVGVDENTAFFIKDRVGTVYGKNGVFIVDNRYANYQSSSYFAGKNFRVNYLSMGDSYNFTTLKAVSNKSLIKIPRYNGYKDSNNIIGAYETTNLLTRLVDQTSGINFGYTKTPSDYPSNTHVFKFKFTKDAKTAGYYGDNRYTVVDAIVNIN